MLRRRVGALSLKPSRRERIDDKAVGDRALLALTEQMNQFLAKSVQVRNLAVVFRHMRARHRIHGRARSVRIIGEVEKIAHLVQCKAEIARTANGEIAGRNDRLTL